MDLEAASAAELGKASSPPFLLHSWAFEDGHDLESDLSAVRGGENSSLKQ